MMGFADTNETTAGVLNRLYARAFVIEDPDTNGRIVFVNCDLMSVMQLVQQEVLAQLAAKYNGVYTDQNVILHATHTHAGPGGTAGYTLYDISISGFVPENFDKIVSGIVDAIDAAHNSMEKGTIRWNKGEVVKGGKNRSPNAYLANPASERALYDGDVDTTMRALHFFNEAGKLRGALAFYPVHPTSLTGKNHLISGDNKGYAEFLLEDELDDVVVGIGKRQYDTLSALLNGESELIEGSVVAKLSYVDFSNVTLRDVSVAGNDSYANRTCPAVVGLNFAAGTEDDRGTEANVTEGDLRPNEQLVSMGAMLQETPQWVKDCQNANKLPLIAVGLMEPVPWVPNILPVQVVKVGQFGIAVTNFETSTMAGRRIRSAMKTVLASAGITEEEYLTQNYEGASTLFGPNQLAAVQQELMRVAASVVDANVPLDVGPTPLQLNRSDLGPVELQTVDSAPSQQSFSFVRSQPATSYSIGSVTSAVFAGAHPMNALTLVSSFCDVQKLDSKGSFTTVMTDAHWDLRYHWERYLDTESKSTCEWNIRIGGRTSVAGQYRFVHRGCSKDSLGKLAAYEGTSNTFTLTA
ncbi:Neutral/alkaline non-lysosomal ceramidase, C-terminal [Phytophthora cactorum]|nr:Neutral/alkaline non-lysosomal ceramidase, C-terminal [Phytophthora cactorum]